MAPTKRVQMFCNTCNYHWYPRGHALSRKCPSCGSSAVSDIYTPALPVLRIILGLVVLVFVFYWIWFALNPIG